MSKKALGKGLSAIISTSSSQLPVEHEKANVSDLKKDRIIEIDVDAISPNPDQPREHFNEKEIEELAESIKSVGLLQPVIVREENNKFFLIAGERRLRATKKAGLKKIKSIIMEPGEEDNLMIALIENLHRENLDPIEEAKAYKIFTDRFKLKQQEIAARVGKDRATIANSLRLLNLEPEIQQALSEGKISVGHAKVLLAAPSKRQMILYREIITRGISVRELEKKIDTEKSTEDSQINKHIKKNPHIMKMEEKLVSILGTKVEIKHSGKSGRIEIYYYSLDDFERIMDIMKK